MKWPFHDYKPQIDYRDLIKGARRSRDSTATVERHGLKALPDAPTFDERMAQPASRSFKKVG